MQAGPHRPTDADATWQKTSDHAAATGDSSASRSAAVVHAGLVRMAGWLTDRALRFPVCLALGGTVATGLPTTFLTQSGSLGTLVALGTTGCIGAAVAMIGT